MTLSTQAIAQRGSSTDSIWNDESSRTTQSVSLTASRRSSMVDPDVAAEVDALTGALEDRGDERGGGRLAVGAGDPADARAAALEDQVHLAAHRDTMSTRDLAARARPRARPGSDRPSSASAATSSG